MKSFTSNSCQKSNPTLLKFKTHVLLFLTFLFFNQVIIAQTVNGGESSQWFVRDNRTTSNGLPSGGNCDFGLPGSGASVVDAFAPFGIDAFDFAVMLWVNNQQVGGNLSVVGQNANFSTTVISGLNVTLSYYFSPTSATMRSCLSLSNPTGSSIATQIDYANNFGSDARTTVDGSSSGDNIFNTADNWVITRDSGSFDPVNTTILQGPNSPAPLVTTNSVSQTVFNCTGTQGILGTYNLSIPAGETRCLLMFQQLNATAADAQADATAFDSYPLPEEFTAGMTETDLANVVNFRFDEPCGEITITCPADVILECAANLDTTPTSTGSATTTGGCGDVTVSFTDSSVAGCGNTETITRTWTATDDAGNSASCDQIITVQDNTPPTFTAPADTEIFADADCNYDTDVQFTGDVENEDDNCDADPQATFVDAAPVPVAGCPGSFTIERTWSLEDACGNAAADQVQLITVTDNTGPVLTRAAGNQTVSCDDNSLAQLDFWLETAGGAKATDNCSAVSLDQ